MLILGIDPGSQILGYSILEYESGRTPRLVVMDVLYLKRIAEFKLRLHKIHESTLRLIDSYHPDHLAIEAPFVGKNVQSMLKLGKAQGVAIAAALSRDLSYTEYEPAAVKQRVTGNGIATKEQVASVVMSVFNIDMQPQHLDATDAVAVAYTCFLEQTDPLAEMRAQLKQAARRPAKKKVSWSDYLQQHPEQM